MKYFSVYDSIIYNEIYEEDLASLKSNDRKYMIKQLGFGKIDKRRGYYFYEVNSKDGKYCTFAELIKLISYNLSLDDISVKNTKISVKNDPSGDLFIIYKINYEKEYIEEIKLNVKLVGDLNWKTSKIIPFAEKGEQK